MTARKHRLTPRAKAPSKQIAPFTINTVTNSNTDDSTPNLDKWWMFSLILATVETVVVVIIFTTTKARITPSDLTLNIRAKFVPVRNILTFKSAVTFTKA